MMNVVKWAVEKAFSDKLISNKFSRLQHWGEREEKTDEGDALGVKIYLFGKKEF